MIQYIKLELKLIGIMKVSSIVLYIAFLFYPRGCKKFGHSKAEDLGASMDVES